MPPVLLPNLSPWEAGFPFPHENTKSWDKSSHAAQPLIICNKMRNELLIPSDEARKALRHPGSRLHAFRQARGEEGTCLFSARPQPRESGVCLSVCALPRLSSQQRSWRTAGIRKRSSAGIKSGDGDTSHAATLHRLVLQPECASASSATPDPTILPDPSQGRSRHFTGPPL